MNRKQKTSCVWSLVFLAAFLLPSVVLAAEAPEVPYVKKTDQSRDGWDAEAWRIVKRSPSNYEWDNGEKDEANDFTVFQAADGSWQIIGCVRDTTFPGFTRMLFQWETTNFFSVDWTEKGVLLTTDDGPDGIGYKTGTLQAPHVVKDGDLYYMIYNSANAHLMVSTNGKDWAHQKASDGSYTLFKLNKGRDIMLLDNRDVDGLWYAFYCGKSDWKNNGGNATYYHTAENITGPWSGAELLAKRPHWRDVESPFIVRRGGWYYLFLQDQVRAEPAMGSFDLPIHINADFYSESPRWGYAPEIIHHPNGQDYIAAYNDADGEEWEGTEIRPLYWKKSEDK